MPKVSVIIPTHNRADFLKAAINSVLSQTYQDFEIIVVDDASTYATREVVTSFGDPRIHYVRNEVNRGDGGSRNAGILNSSAEYVAFLDDDDEWLPEKLQLQTELLIDSSPSLGGVYTGLINIEKSTGKILGLHIPEHRGHLFPKMFVDSPLVTSCLVLKRQCFETVGLFDEKIPYNNDYDMWIRVAEHFEFEYVKEPLVIYHTHEWKLSTDLGRVIQGWELVIDKYRQYFALSAGNYSRILYNLGILYCLNGNFGKSRQMFIKAIRMKPREVVHYGGLFCSLLGSETMKTAITVKNRIMMPARQRRVCQQLQRLAIESSLDTVRQICQSGRKSQNNSDRQLQVAS
jgi:glycosyltransferase involved in cell wall biosynthesis